MPCHAISISRCSTCAVSWFLNRVQVEPVRSRGFHTPSFGVSICVTNLPFRARVRVKVKIGVEVKVRVSCTVAIDETEHSGKERAMRLGLGLGSGSGLGSRLDMYELGLGLGLGVRDGVGIGKRRQCCAWKYDLYPVRYTSKVMKQNTLQIAEKMLRLRLGVGAY